MNRRQTLVLAFAALAACATREAGVDDPYADARPYPGYEKRRFVVGQGDGFELAQHSYLVERITASWFTDAVDGRPAWFVRVVEGPSRGLVFALVTRGSPYDIETTLQHSKRPRTVDVQGMRIPAPGHATGITGVVFYRIDNPGPSFTGKGRDVFGGAMTIMTESTAP